MTDGKMNNYNIDLVIKFNHLDLIDVPKIVSQVTEKWSNRTLTKVNDSVVLYLFTYFPPFVH